MRAVKEGRADVYTSLLPETKTRYGDGRIWANMGPHAEPTGLVKHTVTITCSEHTVTITWIEED